MNIDPEILRLSVIGENTLRELLELAATTPLNGCFLEFGVYRGGSAWHLVQLANEQGRECHLFDTFTGIPERTERDINHGVGDFGDTNAATVMALIPSAIFHVGMFPQTMTEIGSIAFAHIDCDQYVSCLAAIEHFLPRLVPGGIMWFDDYSCTSGVTMAVDEIFKDNIFRSETGKAYVINETTSVT